MKCSARNDLLAESEELKKPLNDTFLDALNASQLWYIYLGLKRIDLVPELKEGTDALAVIIGDYGVRKREWVE